MSRKHSTDFGRFIKAKGMTQKEIAEKLGITEESVSNKASGKTPWKLGEMKKLHSLFGMEIIELLMEVD